MDGKRYQIGKIKIGEGGLHSCIITFGANSDRIALVKGGGPRGILWNSKVKISNSPKKNVPQNST